MGRASRLRRSRSSRTTRLGPGLNFNLDPATSTAYELGLKWLPLPTQRVNLAVFTAKTKQEIVVNSATGGRTTYANAGRTRRRGVEAEWDADFGSGVTRARELHVAARGIRRCLRVGGTPPVIVPAGSRLPGVPPQQAFGVLNWMPGVITASMPRPRCSTSARSTRTIAIPRSPPPTPSATSRSGFAQSVGRAKFTEYVRVNNFTDVKYVGSVIVGDANGRFFEPAPGRNWFVGASVALTL